MERKRRRAERDNDVHPYGAQPSGNKLLGPDGSEPGAGPLLGRLTDERLLDLLAALTPGGMSRLGGTCRRLYVFCHHEPLWRVRVLSRQAGRFRWAGSWKATYLECVCGLPGWRHRPIAVDRLFSDQLYLPWRAATMPIDPAWTQADNIQRCHRPSAESFRQKFVQPNRPAVLTGLVAEWPAFGNWSRESLERRYGATDFHVAGLDMRLSDYFDYADYAVEEQPLYLFDKQFAAKAPGLAGEVVTPEPFREDLFELLGEEFRPDWQWLIIGPSRSGSSFHQDPNATCAWNACVRGRKKWVLFPPQQTPPGVHPSSDGTHLHSPATIQEWFGSFYEQAQELNPIECIQHPGEIVFVPRRWWHCVINLEETVALTQNFVPACSAKTVLKYLQLPNPIDRLSGIPEELRAQFAERFEAVVKAARPELLVNEESPSLWQSLKSEPPAIAGAASSGFSFGFVADED